MYLYLLWDPMCAIIIIIAGISTMISLVIAVYITFDILIRKHEAALQFGERIYLLLAHLFDLVKLLHTEV